MTTYHRTLQALNETPTGLSNAELRLAVGTPHDGPKFRRLVLQPLLNDLKIYEEEHTFFLTPAGQELAQQNLTDGARTLRAPTKVVYDGHNLWTEVYFRPGSQDFLRVPSFGNRT